MRSSTVILSLFLLLQNAAAQAPANPDVGARVLPSLVRLSIQKSDGGTTSANGFLAVKDGVLAVPWHLVRDARSVVARFSSGEVYECSGIIDRDERRNVALVRIKVFGKPVLKMDAREPAPGSALAVAAVKDGSFGMIGATITETGSVGGMKTMRLAGDIPGQNSGSPVVDDGGNVLGMFVEARDNGTDLLLALPAAYLLGLDSSLPTRPWNASAPGASAPAAAAPAAGAASAPAIGSPYRTNDEVDQGIASTLGFIYRMFGSAHYWTEHIFSSSRFGKVDNAQFYTMQSDIANAQTRCEWLRTDDPLRGKLLHALGQILAREKSVIDNFIQCNMLNSMSPRQEDPAREFEKRARSTLLAVPEQVALLQPDLAALGRSSPGFLKELPLEMTYLLGLKERRSRLFLGAPVWPQAPNTLMLVYDKSLADELGLREGDTLLSVNGREVKEGADIEDFKLALEESAGKPIETVVMRYNKRKVLRMKLPSGFPQKYLRAPGGILWP